MAELMGAILHAEQVPLTWGHGFANQYLAYESLSGAMHRCCLARAVHNDTRVAGPQANLNAKRLHAREDDAWQKTENIHPVVRTHPETSQRAVY